MDAIRCLDCGDVRWSLMGIKGRPPACAMCGGETVPERRRPAGSRLAPGERRDLAVPSAGRGDAPGGHRPTA